MRLDDILNNPTEFERRIIQSYSLASEEVEVNKGIKSAAELEAILEQNLAASIDIDWKPLYDAAESFD